MIPLFLLWFLFFSSLASSIVIIFIWFVYCLSSGRVQTISASQEPTFTSPGSLPPAPSLQIRVLSLTIICEYCLKVMFVGIFALSYTMSSTWTSSEQKRKNQSPVWRKMDHPVIEVNHKSSIQSCCVWASHCWSISRISIYRFFLSKLQMVPLNGSSRGNYKSLLSAFQLQESLYPVSHSSFYWMQCHLSSTVNL